MSRFKVDENCPREFAEILSAAGHDAEYALDESLGGKPDSKLAEAALSESHAIVTLDLDFADVRRFPPSEYPGVIVLRPASQSRSRLIQILSGVLEVLATEQLANRLWIVDESGVRVRE